MIKELVPDVQNVGMIYSSSEPNSKYQVDEVKRHLEGMGISVTEYSFADSNDLAIITVRACEEVDAIYIPTDNTVASSTEIIDNIALEAGVPVIAGEESICMGCAAATFSISYYDLGYQAGLQAYEILENGADPATMEIQYAQNVRKLYVAERCEKLGITVPEGYTEIMSK
jgi:putative ABC transport system substrate-binding protein